MIWSDDEHTEPNFPPRGGGGYDAPENIWLYAFAFNRIYEGSANGKIIVSAVVAKLVEVFHHPNLPSCWPRYLPRTTGQS